MITNLKQTIKSIFPNEVPLNETWEDSNEILNILNKIGSVDESNHLFYPTGGGFDLKGASNSLEPNCIEIHTGVNEIVNPRSLTFHSFPDDPDFDWAYFRLELNELKQSGVYESNMEFDEELAEIAPVHYVDRAHWDDNNYNGEELPSGSRLVVRRMKGPLVIFGKDSSYNHHNSTYDGRHKLYNDEQFRDYIHSVRTNGWDK